MVRRKLKRLLAPSFWKVAKKKFTWVVSPSPGPHKKFECIPLQILLRDILKVVETGREAKKVIARGEVWVDGKPRKDYAYPAGLYDVVWIPKLKKIFRIISTPKGLELVEIDEKEKDVKLVKILNKTTIKGGKTQLNLNDGKNILVEDGSKFKTGDSLLIKLPSLEIVEHLPLKKGMLALIMKGKNKGKMGKVVELIPGKFRTKPKVILEVNGNKIEALKDYVFVIGKDKPIIKVVK
ncbi:MAG: 30S ribosomal protein S4e [Candidatus Aenigmarchaeota archaeon ex4484_224]|nr:MAG: 30S ribosomal protein S4e [Candidatus Aenigmarchaeota archaeon ex4484_224]